jgi:hypothetical protein
MDINATEHGAITISGVEIILVHNSVYHINGCITIPCIWGSVTSILQITYTWCYNHNIWCGENATNSI